MTEEESKQYWFRAGERAFPEVTHQGWEKSKALSKLLDVHYPRSGYHSVLILSDSLKSKLIMLSGAHARTYRKYLEHAKDDYLE